LDRLCEISVTSQGLLRELENGNNRAVSLELISAGLWNFDPMGGQLPAPSSRPRLPPPVRRALALALALAL
jgi:hypothetical protein